SVSRSPGVVQLGHYGSAPAAPEGVSLKEAQVEGTHTPRTPSQGAQPLAAAEECVSVPVKASFDFFPLDEADQSALRATILTPPLSEWAKAHGIHLDLVAEFEHWLNDGVSNGRRKRDFIAAFKCWLQSPLRLHTFKPGLSRMEQRQQDAAAAKRRFLEEDIYGPGGQKPVSGRSGSSRSSVLRSHGRAAPTGLLAGPGAQLHDRGVGTSLS